MRLAKHLDDIQKNKANQQFALKLTSEIKSQFKNEWEKDQKNDVFLGLLCSILCFYEERYACYKRAYDTLVEILQQHYYYFQLDVTIAQLFHLLLRKNLNLI